MALGSIRWVDTSNIHYKGSRIVPESYCCNYYSQVIWGQICYLFHLKRGCSKHGSYYSVIFSPAHNRCSINISIITIIVIYYCTVKRPSDLPFVWAENIFQYRWFGRCCLGAPCRLFTIPVCFVPSRVLHSSWELTGSTEISTLVVILVNYVFFSACWQMSSIVKLHFPLSPAGADD